MAKFRSVKAALGHYFAFRRGPQLAQREIGPRVQSSPHNGGHEDWMKMAGVIRDVCHRHSVGRSVLLRWAGTSDGAVAFTGKLAAVVTDLRKELEALDLVEPKTKAVECEDHWFEDLNTGEMVRTKRAK